MNVKKGFLKNNWPMMAMVLIVVYLAASTRSIPMILVAVIAVIALVLRYRKYDGQEQEADDWWRALSKEDKKKVKEGWMP